MLGQGGTAKCQVRSCFLSPQNFDEGKSEALLGWAVKLLGKILKQDRDKFWIARRSLRQVIGHIGTNHPRIPIEYLSVLNH